jgi:predicted metal-dependent enzyme (double-stranded beta helix superfamily)
MCEDLSVFDPLVTRLREAVRLRDDARIAACVKAEIESFIASRSDAELRLPERFYQKDPECGKYGRRPLVAEDGLNVLIMTWEKGQLTPLHDHNNTWCVEGVLQGHIAVTRYELRDRTPAEIHEGDLVRFERDRSWVTGRGEATALHGADQYHVLANPSQEETALTLHVYGRQLMRCTVFHHDSGELYRATPAQLHLTEDAPVEEPHLIHA